MHTRACIYMFVCMCVRIYVHMFIDVHRQDFFQQENLGALNILGFTVLVYTVLLVTILFLTCL